MPYAVKRPLYRKTGETMTDPKGQVIEWNEVSGWVEHGVIDAANEIEAMRLANERFPRGRKFGYSHVIEIVLIH